MEQQQELSYLRNNKTQVDFRDEWFLLMRDSGWSTVESLPESLSSIRLAPLFFNNILE